MDRACNLGNVAQAPGGAVGGPEVDCLVAGIGLGQTRIDQPQGNGIAGVNVQYPSYNPYLANYQLQQQQLQQHQAKRK